MSKIGKREQHIIDLCRKNGGVLTKKEAVAAFGHWYFHNGEKWIGDILSRLVKRNVFEREKPGVYIFRKTPISGPVEQIKLF